MTEERTRSRGRPAARDEEPLDPEQAEALSRAAREAVRQPADPRLERSFAHLGLAAEPDQPPPAPSVASRAAAGARPSLEAEPLVEALADWQRAADEIRRRLEVLTWLLAGVIVLIGLVAVILIVRGPG